LVGSTVSSDRIFILVTTDFTSTLAADASWVLCAARK
jgi:hypothetical protein